MAKRLSLHEIYRQIPQWTECRQCGGCCGRIVMTKLEMQNIINYCEEHKLTFAHPANLVPNRDVKKVTVKHAMPSLYIDNLQTLTVTRYVNGESDGRVTFNMPIDADCPFLNTANKCSIYPVRPFICRLYNNTPDFKCPNSPDTKKFAFTTAEANRLYRQTREAWL